MARYCIVVVIHSGTPVCKAVVIPAQVSSPMCLSYPQKLFVHRLSIQAPPPEATSINTQKAVVESTSIVGTMDAMNLRKTTR